MYLLAYTTHRPGLLREGWPFYREARSSTGIPASDRKGGPLTERPGYAALREAGPHREAGLLTGRLGLSPEGRAFHREAKPLTGELGLPQGDQVSQRKAGPLTGRPGLSQGGLASHREAGPLTG